MWRAHFDRWREKMRLRWYLWKLRRNIAKGHKCVRLIDSIRPTNAKLQITRANVMAKLHESKKTIAAAEKML